MKRIYSRLFVWKNLGEVLGYFMFSFIIYKLLRQSRVRLLCMAGLYMGYSFYRHERCIAP